MSLLPAFPGQSIKVSRSTLFATSIAEGSEGVGVETRLSTWSAPRYRYDIQYNFLRDSEGEVAALSDFVEGSRLTGFTLTDPVSGSVVAVRLEGELRLTMVLPGIWAAQVRAIST